MKTVVIRSYVVKDHSTEGYYTTKVADNAIPIGFDFPDLYCYIPDEKPDTEIGDWRFNLCGTGRPMYVSLEGPTKHIMTVNNPDRAQEYYRFETRRKSKKFASHLKECKTCRETYKNIKGAVEYWNTHDEEYFENWKKCPKCKGKGCKKCEDLPGGPGYNYTDIIHDDFRLDL